VKRSDARGRSGSGRDETEEERLDRNLEELLGELASSSSARSSRW